MAEQPKIEQTTQDSDTLVTFFVRALVQQEQTQTDPHKEGDADGP